MRREKLFLISIFVVFATVVAEESDVFVVQTILEKCGLSDLQADNVAEFQDGRVVKLNLKNRDISKDGITFLPAEVGNLSELRELICSGNIIDSLPSEIGSLVKLEKLDLSSNRLVVLNPAIGKLVNLVNLDLRYNRIERLPPELWECKKLAVLQLWGNKLTTLDEGIIKMPALEELYLNDNRLTMLPAGIMKMKLRYIDVRGNRLCNLDPALTTWLKKKDTHFTSTQKCW